MQQQQNLQVLFTYNKPGVNLLQISIVRQLNAELQFQRKIFCFLCAIQGVATQGGNRTFDYHNRINMKVEYDKILALGKAIRAYALGAENSFGPFSIYVDSSKSQFGSGSGAKSMRLQRGIDNKTNAPIVALFFKTQTSPNAIVMPLTIPEALALSDICQWIAMKCVDLDFELTSTDNFQTRVVKPKTVDQPQPAWQQQPTTSFSTNNVSNFSSQPDSARPVEKVVNNFSKMFEENFPF